MWMAECAGRHGLLEEGEIPSGETPLLDALQVDGSNSDVSVLSDGRPCGSLRLSVSLPSTVWPTFE